MATTTIRLELTINHAAGIAPALVRAQIVAALEQFSDLAIAQDDADDEFFVKAVSELDGQQGE